jgi:cytochrome c oxidase subunit IV
MSPGAPATMREIVFAPLLSWLALLILLALTIGLAYVPLGRLNLVVALAIAGLKDAIVALIFMELIHAKPVHRLAAAIGMLWLAFLFLLMFSDYLARPR